MNFHSIVYNALFIPFAKFSIFFLKFFNPKLRERESQCLESLDSIKKLNIKESNRTIWFHSASMGEFEQAKPIIERLKSANKELKIVCSFFSPSGYNNQRNYEFADAVCYLPFDTKRNAKLFLNLLKASIVVFVRYEIWRNFLEESKHRKAKLLLINATAPQSKTLSNNALLRSFSRSNYNLFDYIFTVGEKHSDFFNSLGLGSKVETLSDSRFDRIVEKVNQSRAMPIIPKNIFEEDKLVLICGSTWKEDEDLIFLALKSLELAYKEKIALIIVPHEPTEENIQRLQSIFHNSLLFSKLLELTKKYETDELRKIVGENAIIVNSIGKLLGLYSIADFVYIGGGFGAGIHSVTEPAGYGIPLSCGPKYKVSYDAINLVDLKALSVIENRGDLTAWFEELISDLAKRSKVGKIASDYILNRAGSSEVIVKKIEMLLNAE
ncbi:MAG: hypothetical protein GX121_08475 [Ignavibacteria bacterium]|nr:hypothetical protein [Ignavibacteria bacterium]